MKKLINIVLATILLVGCTDYSEKHWCAKGVIRVLNKQKTPCARGGGWCSFQMYLYNGVEAKWYDTNQETYEAYNVNDTLPTIVLTIVKHETPIRK